MIIFWLTLGDSFHCTENHIFFFQTSWKDGLSKKIALEFDLSCIIRKDDVSFSRKYDLTPWRKIKYGLSQKKYTEIWYFLQMFWKDCLFKKDRAGTWSFLHHLEWWYFFSQKHGIFSLGGKRERDESSQEIRGSMIFSIWYVPRPSAKKNQSRSCPVKIDLKLIGIPDRHPRKNSSNSLYLHGDLYRRFHILLSSKEKRKRNI